MLFFIGWTWREPLYPNELFSLTAQARYYLDKLPTSRNRSAESTVLVWRALEEEYEESGREAFPPLRNDERTYVLFLAGSFPCAAPESEGGEQTYE